MSLRRYFVKRLLLTIPILLGVSILTFSLVKLLPGNAVDFILQFQPGVGQELRNELEAQYNLNQPVWKQYLIWLWDAIHLEFGQSLISDRDVTAAITNALPNSLLLGIAGFSLALGIGIPLGILSAVKNGTLTDEASRVGALLGIATPNFWLGLMLILVFAVDVFGFIPNGLEFRVIPPDAPLFSADMFYFLVLPAVTLGTASAALIMRLTRSSMVEELNKGYVRMARAKGLSERRIILKHVLRNSLISVVTVAALQIAFIVDGTVVVEQVFSWPGVGRLLLNAILQRDFPIIQAVVLLIATTIVFANLLADVAYSLLDPRIRY